MKFVQPVVTGHRLDEVIGHPLSAGRFWLPSTYYLFTLLWDPLILAGTRRCPLLRRAGEALEVSNEARLLTYAAPTDAAEADLVRQTIGAGGAVILNHPSPALLDELATPFRAQPDRPHLVSLRERWDLGPRASRPYYYPHDQPFLRLSAPSDATLTRIGGNPDLVVVGKAAAFAGDPFDVVAAYSNQPDLLARLIVDLAGAFADAIRRMMDQPQASDPCAELESSFDFRRDFHSLGYACMTVRELAYCHGEPHLDLAEVEQTAIAGADALIRGDAQQAEQALRQAFVNLERVNRRYQPVPAVFTDTLHGAELYPDIGFFEFDWPQHPADVLRTYLNWAQTRSYRFNVDFGATTVREMALRFPDLFQELREAQQTDLVEFVNGSSNQPYPLFHSLESQMRQFDVGARVWREVFDDHPRTYASQEYGFCPQIASVLARHGYEQAVLRVQNMGDAPTINEEQIDWIAPNGDRLRTLPSHPHKSEQLNGFTYNNLHLKLFEHFQTSPDFAVFTCMGDVTFHRPMREELARVCHYAPVFGRFETFAGYFDRTRGKAVASHRLMMQDFTCDAAFINLDKWRFYQDYTGNYITHCTRSWRSSALFAAAEAIDACTGVDEGIASRDQVHDRHWEILTEYQGHGNYIVTSFPSGAFLGPYDNPNSRAAQRGVQNLTEYIGPSDQRLVGQISDERLSVAEDEASRRIESALSRLAPPANAPSDLVLFNFAPKRRQLVRINGAARCTYEIDGEPAPAQIDGQDLLIAVPMVAYGLTVLKLREGGAPIAPADDASVSTTADLLENQYLRVRFDPDTGAVLQMVRRSDGRPLLGASSHLFSIPGQTAQRCRRSQVVMSGPLRAAIEFEIELVIESGPPVELLVRATLDATSEVLDIETTVMTAPVLRGDQWTNHLGARYVMAGDDPQVRSAHFNVLEPYGGEKLTSPNVLVAGDLALLNEGAEFFRRHGRDLIQILLVENEPARRFRYALGAASRNPIMQGRAWSAPVFGQHGALAADMPAHLPLIDFDHEDVELLSVQRIHEDADEDGAWLVRLANTTDQAVHARLHGQVDVSLRPWDVQQLRLQPRVSLESRQDYRPYIEAS